MEPTGYIINSRNSINGFSRGFGSARRPKSNSELTPNYFLLENPAMTTLPERCYLAHIKKDLEKKMVFIGGPRQVGKTTLSRSLLQVAPDASYLNWDNELDRLVILKALWPKDAPLVVFDEIHKRKGWQRLIKGYWDKRQSHQNYVVTGSAQLDAFRKSGDSMLGRYHYYRIHPFTLPELGSSPENLLLLFQFGGFPEPLLDRDERLLRRWHLQRVSKLVRVDLRDIENVSDLDKVEILANALPGRVSSTLSRRSLAEDLEVSDKTVKRWLEILHSLYFSYSLAPFGAPKIKAIKKSQKVYLWDWSQVESEGPRFENFVGSHLLKLGHFEQDVNGYRCELRYIRDESGRECDFVFLKNGKAEFAVECKLSRTEIDPGLHFFRQRLKIPRWYQVHLEGNDSETVEPGLKRLSFSRFCEEIQAV